MKKIGLLLCAWMMVISAYSQNYLTYHDIPITGSADELVANLEQEGFRNVATENPDVRLLCGQVNERECTMRVDSQNNVVHRLTLSFPKMICWKTIFYEYVNLRSRLNKKYGHAQSSAFTLDKEYRNTGMEFYALHAGNASYFSSYQMPGGVVTISIVSPEGYDGNVQIVFENQEK